MKLKIKFCPDCQASATSHWQNWLEELIAVFLPLNWFKKSLIAKLENSFSKQISNFFLLTKLAKLESNFSLDKLPPRTSIFIREARQRGIKIFNIKSLLGNTNYFSGMFNKKKFFFESLPRVGWLDKYPNSLIDDKVIVKKMLQQQHFPILSGKGWWWWQKRRAQRWAIEHLDYPLVVKPRSGTFSRHITTDINNPLELKRAIDRAINYAPTFLIERYLPNVFVYRGTVVDFKMIACAKRVTANVLGDGQHSINELINIKNSNSNRSEIQEKNAIAYKMEIDDVAKRLLQQQNVQLSTILSKNKIIWLQKDPFIRLGAGIVEVTEKVHPDNRRLFQDIAHFFGVRLTGIDLLTQDISCSWRTQPSAILELNSLPGIEMHHFPCSGQAQNVAGAIVDMVLKYY